MQSTRKATCWELLYGASAATCVGLTIVGGRGGGNNFFFKKSGNQGKNIIDLKILCLKKKEKKSCRDNSGSIETFSDVGEGLLKLFFLFFGE